MSETKIDGLNITCGPYSLWVSREAISDMLQGVNPSAGHSHIVVKPNIVRVD